MRIVCLTKTGSLFGHLEQGTRIPIRISDRLSTTQRNDEILSRRMLKRDNPAENEMEWKTEVVDDDCFSCGEEMLKHECPRSKRPCGHHCNCSWVHDHCHWCDKEFGENSG